MNQPCGLSTPNPHTTGCNRATNVYPKATSHGWFQQWEEKGEHTMRFFIEPVALAAACRRTPLCAQTSVVS